MSDTYIVLSWLIVYQSAPPSTQSFSPYRSWWGSCSCSSTSHCSLKILAFSLLLWLSCLSVWHSWRKRFFLHVILKSIPTSSAKLGSGCAKLFDSCQWSMTNRICLSKEFVQSTAFIIHEGNTFWSSLYPPSCDRTKLSFCIANIQNLTLVCLWTGGTGKSFILLVTTPSH